MISQMPQPFKRAVAVRCTNPQWTGPRKLPFGQQVKLNYNKRVYLQVHCRGRRLRGPVGYGYRSQLRFLLQCSEQFSHIQDRKIFHTPRRDICQRLIMSYEGIRGGCQRYMLNIMPESLV